MYYIYIRINYFQMSLIQTVDEKMTFFLCKIVQFKRENSSTGKNLDKIPKQIPPNFYQREIPEFTFKVRVTQQNKSSESDPKENKQLFN